MVVLKKYFFLQFLWFKSDPYVTKIQKSQKVCSWLNPIVSHRWMKFLETEFPTWSRKQLAKYLILKIFHQNQRGYDPKKCHFFYHSKPLFMDDHVIQVLYDIKYLKVLNFSLVNSVYFSVHYSRCFNDSKSDIIGKKIYKVKLKFSKRFIHWFSSN